MKRLLVLVCLCGIVLYFGQSGSARAENLQSSLDNLGVLSETDNSVTKVMQRAGCDFNWLSQALADSNIDPRNLRRLPVGQPVFIQSGLCKTPPPRNITNLSRIIFEIDANSGFVSVPANFQEKLKEAEDSRNQTLAENARLQNEITRLNSEKTKAEGELASARSSLASRQGLNPTYAAILFLVGLIFGLLGMYFRERDLKKESIIIPKEVIVKENHREYVYPLVGASTDTEGGEIVGKYSCPECSEKNISMHNVRRHLISKHLTINPEVVRSSAETRSTTTRVVRPEQH